MPKDIATIKESAQENAPAKLLLLELAMLSIERILSNILGNA